MGWENIRPKKQGSAPQEVPKIGLPEYGLTDLGNAYRFRDQWGSDVRWCDSWGKFLVFDTVRWALDQKRKIELLGVKTVQQIYAEAAQTRDKDTRKALADHAKRSESDSKRKAMLSSVKCLLPILPDQFDRDPWLLNVLNGTVDLRTGELRPHNREDFITKLAPVEYDAEAECPTWWKFLRRIFRDNFSLIEYVQKAIGYCLTGDTREQCLFLFYGLGANGKSTFLEVIQVLLGDYATQTNSETFMVKRHSSPISNDVADLRGARFVCAVEIELGRRMAEVLIKQMTGGDKLKARFLYSEHFEFKPEFKIFLAANHKPVIRGTDHAIWRRIHLVPFKVQIPNDEQDKRLVDKLKAELPGILNWAIEGCILWQEYGLKPPEEVQAATQEYREEMDVIGDWLAECCIVAPGAEALAADLYDSYSEWAQNNGEKRPLSQKVFGQNLTIRGFASQRETSGLAKGKKKWLGVSLPPSE